MKARSVFCSRHDCSMEASLSAVAAFADPALETVESPRWSEAPTRTQTQWAHPFVPNMLGISGWAVLRCHVTVLGLLDACVVVSDAPQGLGFGSAALSLSGRYRLAADQLPGAAGKSVLLPSTFFAVPDSPEPPYAPAPSPSQSLAWKVVQADGTIRRAAEQDADNAQRLLLNNRTPGIAEATRRDAGEALRGAMIEVLPNALSAYGNAYASALPEADLQAQLAFLNSPAGRLTTGGNPEFDTLMVQSFNEIWLGEVAAARATFCKTRDCGPPPGP